MDQRLLRDRAAWATSLNLDGTHRSPVVAQAIDAYTVKNRTPEGRRLGLIAEPLSWRLRQGLEDLVDSLVVNQC